jgi:hypothetical protein
MKKIIISLLVFVLICSTMPFTAFATVRYTYTSEWCYKLENGGVYIDSYLKNTDSDTFIIPDSIDGYPVIGIVGLNLNEENVVKTVIIPQTVKFIDGSVNDRSCNLEQILVNENNPYFCSVDGVVYDKEMTTIYLVPSGRTGVFVIPDSVQHINPFAFDSCSKLEKVILPNTMISIGQFAFYQCRSLKSINLPDSITSIGRRAFYGAGLEEVTLPANLGVLEEEVFACNNRLKKVSIPEGVITIKKMAFFHCGALRSVTLPSTVKKIETAALGQIDHSTYDCISWETSNGFSIYGIPKTEAQIYAERHEISFFDSSRVYDLMGDVSGDAVCNAEDALMVLKHAVGKILLHDNQIAVGDIDQNGVVNASDALLVLRLAVGS